MMIRPPSVIVLTALVLCASAVSAQTAPVTTAQAPITTAQAPVDRLFFTPVERGELEKRRFAPPPPPPRPAAVVAAIEPTVAPSVEYTTLNGHVWRPDGKTTTWVNGQPRHDSARGTGESVQVRVVGDTKQTVNLKVGQTYERLSRERSDALRGGEIRINAKP